MKLKDDVPPARVRWSEIVSGLKIGESFTVITRNQANSCVATVKLKGMECRMKYNKDTKNFTIWRTK